MNSYQILKAAIHHQQPERLPVCFDSLGVSDRAWVNAALSIQCQHNQPGEDVWGCIWDQTEMKNMGQVKYHPFAHSGLPADYTQTKFPDYNDQRLYQRMEETIQQAEQEGKYITSSIFMVLFERMHSLYGFENLLMGLVDEDEQDDVARLADHIVDVHLTYIHNLHQRFPGRIHGMTMTDDFGTQQAAFVSSDFWMEFFYPRYKKLFDAMHDCGYDVWVHSCGKVNEIIECYIKAGVDVVNLQQPRALGIEEIGDRYRGRVCFESLSDIQATLPSGNTAAVDADVDALMQHWADHCGGFILSDYGDGEAIGVNPDMKLYMYEQFSKASAAVYGQPLPAVTACI